MCTYSTICSGSDEGRAELRTVYAVRATEEHAKSAGTPGLFSGRQPAVNVYHEPVCSSASFVTTVPEPCVRWAAGRSGGHSPQASI